MKGREDNPYTSPTTVSAIPRDPPEPIGSSSAFLVGLRKGALRSLFVAVPTAASLYVEFSFSGGYGNDPETGERIRVNLAASEILLCAVAAIATTAVMVTLPWALATALVYRRRAVAVPIEVK